ncbi:alpha/beta hydrolase family protein [Actinomycetospora straminea]|uniref:Alpha/beta fold hydrolase n=1 Tax=Actinomycetospora straminea TaxID=663607 RepID=A0ABP9EKN9_9PSEU|nr:hypothetical protein [Actinomycetospora straminea]MDD7933856.1 hypothetical protein [Actinomycetospora straminea]
MTAPASRDGVVAPFFADPDFDFEFRDALGAAAYGVGDVGLWLATAARIVDGDRESWFTAWSDRGRELAALAEASATDPADLATAAWAYLAASSAWSRAMGAIDGLPPDRADAALLPTFRESRRCWEAMIDASSGRHVRLEVPYEDTTLPAWLLRPDASGTPRPTLVMTNGSDGALTGLWSAGAAEALAHGWNAVVYDGPGQQSLLFERGIPFRPDWEAVLTPVVDALVARADVDPAALTAYGISQAGYWLPRALSAEHRFVAAVADPGVVDVSTSWMGHLPPPMTALLDAGDKATFDRYMAEVGGDPAAAREFAFRARPYGVDDPYDLFTAVRTYQLRDVAADIRTPLLITSPDDEQFWPGQSDELADLLTSPREVLRFTRADGANLHCQPLGRRLTATRMIGWLDARIQRRPST